MKSCDLANNDKRLHFGRAVLKCKLVDYTGCHITPGLAENVTASVQIAIIISHVADSKVHIVSISLILAVYYILAPMPSSNQGINKT
uniref:Uncharacterized protein n=1 Tax=Pararge aegeria TaxID=116150 RepID=S4NSW6_9NEOP